MKLFNKLIIPIIKNIKVISKNINFVCLNSLPIVKKYILLILKIVNSKFLLDNNFLENITIYYKLIKNKY